MKVFVTGANGQLGYDLMKELEKRGHQAIGSGIQKNSPFFFNYLQLDITEKKAVEDAILNIKPDAIINCAAWTAVDKAEDNKEMVYKINALAPKYLAEAANKNDAKILQVSTDYVFDGRGAIPFEIDSPKHGLSTYGRTKSDGEDFVILCNKKHFVVRTTGLFGINGNNFVNTMLRLADMGNKELNVVNDQVVSVTYAKDLAVLLVDMIETDMFGIYHAANGGYLSWYEFSKEIFQEAKINVIVRGVTTEEYKNLVPGQADRPKNSRLSLTSLDKAGFVRLPDHLDALRRFLIEKSK